jgi:hypothetical protein
LLTAETDSLPGDNDSWSREIAQKKGEPVNVNQTGAGVESRIQKPEAKGGEKAIVLKNWNELELGLGKWGMGIWERSRRNEQLLRIAENGKI